jgi:hypothetical protein
MKYLVICFILLSFSLYANVSNKIKVNIFSNEESCWTCLKGTDLISKLELKNIEIDITLYFCNESQELLNSLLKDYDLKINSFLDPLCLYAKNYNFSFLPAIIIKDTKDSIVLKEVWENPQKYVQLIKKIDNDFIADANENNNFVEGLEFINSLTLKKTAEEPIYNNMFSGFYNSNNNRYYGFIGKATELSIFDSNGIIIDTINIEQDGVICFYPTAVLLANDSNIIWSDFLPAVRERFFYSLNLNTKLITRKVRANKSGEPMANRDFIQIPNTNKFVCKLEVGNTYLDNNSKLLLIIDEKDSASYYFGHPDSILSTLKMSCFMWTSACIEADNNSNIYSLSPLSNKLAMYDENGNYNKIIYLEFNEGFLEKPIDLTEDVAYTDKMIDIYLNYKNLYKLFVLDNDIFVVHNIVVPNSEEFKFRDKKYWLTHFDKNGKKIGNTIQLPINYQPIYINNNKILIQHLDFQTGKIFLQWYKLI